MAAYFHQILPAEREIPSYYSLTVGIHFLLDGGSLPPDLPVNCVKQIMMPIRNGFVKGGGEREVRRLIPIVSVIIPIDNIKKMNNMRLPKPREQPAGKIWFNPLCCHYPGYRRG